MRYFITTSIKASFLGVCLVGSVSLNALANTGSAITGDSAGGNPDSSTFTGDIFVAPSSTGEVNFDDGRLTNSAGRPRPKNWTCNLPFNNQESSLRFKTLATMLSTNLAGSNFLTLLQPPPESKIIQVNPNEIATIKLRGPLFECKERLNYLGVKEENNDVSSLRGNPQGEINNSGGASLLQPPIVPDISMTTSPQSGVNFSTTDFLQPTTSGSDNIVGQPNTTSGSDDIVGQPTTTSGSDDIVGQPTTTSGSTPDNKKPESSSLCLFPSLLNYLGRPSRVSTVTWTGKNSPRRIPEKAWEEMITLQNAQQIQDSLLTLLGLPTKLPRLTAEEEFCGIYDKVKTKKDGMTVVEPRPVEEIQALLVRDLVTTLFGLTWNKTLLGDSEGETLVDANQFAAAVKTYNELINLLNENQLKRWSLPPEQWPTSANANSNPSSLMVVGRELTTEEKQRMTALTSEQIAAGRRAAQDITATLKMMRSACNCGWENLWVDEQNTQTETVAPTINP